MCVCVHMCVVLERLRVAGCVDKALDVRTLPDGFEHIKVWICGGLLCCVLLFVSLLRCFVLLLFVL